MYITEISMHVAARVYFVYESVAALNRVQDTRCRKTQKPYFFGYTAMITSHITPQMYFIKGQA